MLRSIPPIPIPILGIGSRPIPISIPILGYGSRPIPIPIPILSFGLRTIPIPILAQTPIPQYQYQCNTFNGFYYIALAN